MTRELLGVLGFVAIIAELALACFWIGPALMGG